MPEVAQPMTDNEALVAILEEVRRLEGELFANYTVSGESLEVLTGATGDNRKLTRDADEDTIKTVVTAIGDGDVDIFENDVFVARINNTTWEHPIAGAGEIRLEALAAAGTISLFITSFIAVTEE